MLAAAGFEDIRIDVKADGQAIVASWMPGSGAEKYVTSAYVTARKPTGMHGCRDDVFRGAVAPPPAPVVLASDEPAAAGC